MRNFLLFVYLIAIVSNAWGFKLEDGPVNIGDRVKPDASTVLQLSSTTTGFAPPRMTEAERDAIVAPITGLQIFNLDTLSINIFNGGTWAPTGGGGADHPLWTASTGYGIGAVIIDDVGGYKVYRSNTAHTSDAIALINDLVNWDELSTHPGRLLNLPTTTLENTVQSDTFDITPLLVKGKTVAIAGIPVIWTNAVNVSVVSNLVTKTGGGGGWNAGAFSTQSFVSSTLAHVEWTILDTTKLFILGLSATDPDQDRVTVEFGIYSIGTVAQVWENGVSKYSFGAHIVGDTYSVRVTVINTIEYYKNGVLEYTSIVPPTFPLFVDVAFHTVGGSVAPTITNAGMVQTENIFEVQSDSGDSHFSIAPLGETVIEEIHIKDDAGGEYVGFTAPAVVASSTLYTLPDADGTSGQLLSTNGSLVLDWIDPTNNFTDPKINTNFGGNQAAANAGDAGLEVTMTDAQNAGLAYDSTLASSFKIGESNDYREVVTVSDVQDLVSKEYANTAALDANLVIDMISTTKSSRPCPQMTEAQRDLLTTVDAGCIFNTDTSKLNIYDGAAWTAVGSGGGLDAWLTATVYIIGNVVHESNKIYLALTNHTSGTFATDLGNNDWIELSDDLNRETSVTDNAIPRWDGVGGDDVQDSLLIVSDLGALTGAISGVFGDVQVGVTATNTIDTLTLNNPLVIAGNGTRGVRVSGNTTANRVFYTDSNGDMTTNANLSYDATTLAILGVLDIDDLRIDGGVISNTVLNNDIDLTPNGTGSVNVTTGNLAIADQGELRLGDADNSDYVGFKSPTALTASTSFILPDGDGLIGQVLKTDGAATLEWADSISSSDVIYVENFNGKTAPFSMTSGDDPIFDNGGVLSGTLGAETVSPINGDTSFKYTQAAGSISDWIKSAAITVGKKEQSNSVWVSGSYTYDGANNDIVLVGYDNTNSEVVSSSGAFLEGSSKSIQFEFEVPISSTTTSISWGIHTKVLNSGKILLIDDVEISHKEKLKNQTIRQTLKFSEAGNTLADRNLQIRFSGALTTSVFKGPTILKVVDNAGSTRTDFECILAKCFIHVAAEGIADAGSLIEFLINGTLTRAGTEAGTGNFLSGAWNFELESGQVFSVGFRSGNAANTGSTYDLGIIATADSLNVVVPSDSVSPIRYSSNAAQTFTTNVVTIIDNEDLGYDDQGIVTTGAAWNYVAPSKGKYRITAMARSLSMTASAIGDGYSFRLYVDGVFDSFLANETAETTSSKIYTLNGASTIELERNEVLTIRMRQDLGSTWTNQGTGTYNWVTIEKIDVNTPFASIPAPQYETKLLTSSASGTGVVSDLTFDNLTVGLWYEVSGLYKMQDTGSGLSSVKIYIEVDNGATKIAQVRFNNELGTANITNFAMATSPNYAFKAEATTLTFNISSITSALLVGGIGKASTYITLKEMPAATETSKF